MSSIPSISKVQAAVQHLKDIPIVKASALENYRKLSEKYECNIYLKREDTQITRSFKMRTAVNYYIKLTSEQKKAGVIAASDGNFSLAVAFACNHFKVHTTLFITKLMQNTKIDQIQSFGKEYITLVQSGDYFEESLQAAKQESTKTGKTLLHPFDSYTAIVSSGTIAWEIVNEKKWDLDYVFTCVGGGGLAAGMSIVLSELSPDTKIIGVEPEDTCSMSKSLKAGKVVGNDVISRFCDGSSVKQVGETNFKICQDYLERVETVSEGQISSSILQLYDNGIIVEPSGALALAALEQNRQEIKGKNVVIIVSGGNTDLLKLDMYKEIALMHEGLKYFFMINFPLRQGILKEFIKNCLEESDEISHIQFNKKSNREIAPAIVAIEVKKKNDINRVIENMKKMKLTYKVVNQDKELYDLLI